MVQKNLISFLVLLWITPQFMDKRSVMPKFRKMNKINFRQEDEIVNSLHSCTSVECSIYRTYKDGEIYIMRHKRDTGIQYRHDKKEDVMGFILKLIVQPKYRTVYQHQGIHRASNPNPLNDDTRSNDNELHQQLCGTFQIDYLQEMDIITKVKVRLECKINITLLALLPNKITGYPRGPATFSDETGQDKLCSRNKRAIPLLAIAQGTAAIGGMLVKGINALVDAKRVSSFNNAIKMLNANVDITHNRLVTLENRTSMMVKAIMPVLKDLQLQINKTNEQLASQYRMMSSAHNTYNLLFRQMHETQMINHFALLLFKDYLTIQVGTLQRIHRQYIRYESVLDDTLIGIENFNSGYLTHHILNPQVLTKYLETIEDNLEETAPKYEPVFMSVYQYYGNSLASFTNNIDDLLFQLPILIKLKVQVPMSLFSIETVPVPLDVETYIGDKREYTQIILKIEYIALTDNNYVQDRV